jgi:tRNA A-37 threonylcarbamoyl transferase component Bud32
MTISLDYLHAVEAAGVRWRMLPGWEERLLGPQGLRLDEWLDQGAAHIVKQGPHRTVYRVRLPDVCFYLKHYRMADLGARIRSFFRPVKAWREFQHALTVAQRSFPTVEPVALGERRIGKGAGESFIITQGLEQVQPLGRYLEQELLPCQEPRHSALRQAMGRALGEFLARMHAAGIAHHDLHASNIMVRIEAAGPVFFLLDLDAVRVATPLSWRASCANLALFNRYFILRASQSDRARFWRAYCRARALLAADRSEFSSVGWTSVHPRGLKSPLPPEPSSDDRRAHAIQLENETWRSNVSFWIRRDRRCLRTNRYYYRFQRGACTGHALAEIPRADLDRLLTDPDRAMSEPGVRLLKNSPSSRVALLSMSLAGRPCAVILKRFAVRRWSDPLTALVRPTPALRSWINGNGLRERLLPTARPLAIWHRIVGGLAREGYLLTEYVPDSRDLHGRLHDLTEAADCLGLRKEIDAVARLVRSLHQRHLSQRDLKAGNILIGPQGPILIDLVGLRVQRKLGPSRRVQNIARLNASFHAREGLTRTDRLRFLRTYMNWGLRGRSSWKTLWRAVAVATQIKTERNRRTGRPLA